MKKAFTLIELLIVIAIIGILASVIVISLSDQSGKAEKEKARFNVAQAVRYAAIQASDSNNDTDDEICPNGSDKDLSTETGVKGNLYCNYSSVTSMVGYVVYEVFDGTKAICADSTVSTNTKGD